MNPKALIAATASALLLAGCNCGGVPPGSADGGPDGGINPDGGRLDGGSSTDGDGGPACVPFPTDGGTRVAQGLDRPRRLAIDDTFLYICEAGPFRTDGGRVTKVPLVGGSPSTVAQGPFQEPDAIAVDATAIYLLDLAGLYRIPKATGTPQLLRPLLTNARFGDTSLQVAGDQLVVSVALSTLDRIGTDGGAFAPLYTGPGGSIVRAPVVVGGTVFFLVSQAPQPGLYQVALDGGPASRVRPVPLDGRGLTAHGGDLYWTEGSGGDGGVFRAPLDGGTVTRLAGGLQGPDHPVVANGVLYFSDATAIASPSFLQGISLCAPGAAIPVGPSGLGPGEVLFDGSSLFFTSAEGAPSGFVGRLP